MKIPKFLKKKRNLWIISILLILIFLSFLFFNNKNDEALIQTGIVKLENIEETVLATGQIVSGTDLSLSFQSGGIVRQISVKEGDKVYQGQVLASLNQSSILATLTSAEGSLAQAQASYDKLINGASKSEIQVLQNSIDLAQVNLDNTYNGAKVTLNNAYTAIYNAYTTVTTLTNNYFSTADQEGIKVQENKININNNLVKAKLSVDQTSDANGIDLAIINIAEYLNSTFNSLQIIRDQCDQGIYYSRVTSADKASLDAQKGYIITAMTSVNSLQSTLASYKVNLRTAKDNLSARQEKPRQEDINLAEAQVLSAKGQVDSAKSLLNNLVIIAPSAGTITKVDIKIGEQAIASKEVMVLQDVDDLHVEADVSEANVASLQVGQDIDYTFDALGPDKHFLGKVLTINPASTIVSGVVNYLVKGSFDNVTDIKPGMTANMTIMIAQKEKVLAVPSTAVINRNGKQYIRVIDNVKEKTYHEVEVITGLEADGGLIEIISGISEGEEIIIYMKS